MKMEKFTSVIFTLCIAAASVSAQKYASKSKPVEWEDNPKVHPVPPAHGDEPAIWLLNDINLDYRYEGRDINVYYTLHRIIKALDYKGIEMYNKIEISVGSNTRVPLIKARTILPNGKVIEVAKDMMKVTKNEYGQHKVVIAMEGVEKNAEIELLLKEIKPLSLFGGEYFQYTVPVMNTRFELSYPKDLVFEMKGFNGFPESSDALVNNRRHIKVEMDEIPALHTEPHSFYDLYRMRAEYRISYLTDDEEKKRLYTWDNLGRKIYDNNYKTTNKEKSAVNRYLSSIGVLANGNEADNIKKIENDIKNNIILGPDLGEENAGVLDSVITKKTATESSYLRLFAACFTQAGIAHEFGIATDRTEHRLDSKFENWGAMENYVFYFPNQKKFLSPTSIYLRYPFVPDALLTNKAVFCTIPPDGVTSSTLTEIKTIPPTAPTESQSNISAEVSFSKNMETHVAAAYTFSGYAALNLRKDFIFQLNDKRKDVVKRVVSFADNKDEIDDFAVSNENVDNYNTNTPLKIHASVHPGRLLETAGNQYLFKIGEILGRQEELYSNKDRKMPVDLPYPKSVSHTITVNIPAGYKIQNPEALRMHADYVDKDLKPVVGFKSDYTIKSDKKGNKLIVTVTEFYSQLHFSVGDYERYRKVVNTAADFNKVTLLMRKG
jgi:hypothetical protein